MKYSSCVIVFTTILGSALPLELQVPSRDLLKDHSVSHHNTKMTAQNPAVAPYWLDDKSAAFDFSQSDASTGALAVTTESGSPSNAMYIGSGPLPEGGSTWRLMSQHGSKSARFSFGVTDKDNFNSQWKLRGALFNGLNLSNGSALLRSDYGFSSAIKDVLMHVKLQKDGATGKRRLQVWYAADGVSLGLAYDISSDSQYIPLELYPVIAAQGEVRMTLKRENQPEAAFFKRSDLYASTKDPLLGAWRMVKEEAGLNLTDNLFVIRILSGKVGSAAPEKVTYTVSWRVVNNNNMQLTCSSAAEGATEAARQVGERTCLPGAVMATMMMGPENLMAQERDVRTFFEALETVQVNVCADNEGSDTLLLNRGGMELTREFVNFDPYTESPMKPRPQAVTG